MSPDHNFLLVIKSSSLGDGPADLGEKLLENFLKALLEKDHYPGRIICMNSGVFLTTGNSISTGMLKQFESRGSEILSCTTCLEYFQRKDRLLVGRVTTMAETVEAMLSFGRIINL